MIQIDKIHEHVCQGVGPKGSKLTWRLWWRAVAQLQAEAVLDGRACDIRGRPYLQEAYEK